jgi:hypothetical protein
MMMGSYKLVFGLPDLLCLCKQCAQTHLVTLLNGVQPSAAVTMAHATGHPP